MSFVYNILSIDQRRVAEILKTEPRSNIWKMLMADLVRLYHAARLPVCV